MTQKKDQSLKTSNDQLSSKQLDGVSGGKQSGNLKPENTDDKVSENEAKEKGLFFFKKKKKFGHGHHH